MNANSFPCLSTYPKGDVPIECFKEHGHRGAHEGRVIENGDYKGTVVW